jgi:hypothetical protein
MKRLIGILTMGMLGCAVLAASHPVRAAQSGATPQEQAAHYSRMAKDLISTGRLTDGVKMMRMAIKTNPLDPALRMHYVAIMSKKGEQSLREGRRREALAVYRSVEEELLSAAKLFQRSGSHSNAAHAIAQLQRHVFRNEGVARGYEAKAEELERGR